MVLFFHLLMLIIRLFVSRQNAHVGQWPEWPSSAIMLAAMRGRSTAGPPGPRLSQMFFSPAKNFTSDKIYASSRGLLVVPIRRRIKSVTFNIRSNRLVLLSVEKHVVVWCYYKTHVAEETIATTVNELQHILSYIHTCTSSSSSSSCWRWKLGYGHSRLQQWQHSPDCIQVPIHLPLQLWLYLVKFLG